MVKTTKELVKGNGIEHNLTYQRKWINLYEKVVMQLTGKHYQSLTEAEISYIRNGVNEAQYDALMETDGELITDIYEEVDVSHGYISMMQRLNFLLETVYVHSHTLRSGRKVIQLDYSKLFGSKWNAISENSRGIVFDAETLEVLSLPFHKFFNVNEREETRLENLNLTEKGYVMEKLDGTMIHVFLDDLDNGLYFATRGTVLNELHNRLAEDQFTAQEVNLDELRAIIQEGYTPLFELLLEESHEYRHTVSYDQREVRLIAMRHRTTGEYVIPAQLGIYAEKLGVTSATFDDEKTFFDVILEKEFVQNTEGWVVMFESGLFVKVKAHQYMSLMDIGIVKENFDHKSSSLPKIVHEWMKHDIQDDKISQLPTQGMRDQAFGVVEDILDAVRKVKAEMQKICDELYVESQKEFAQILRSKTDIPNYAQPVIFRLRAGSEVGVKQIPEVLLEKYMK
ncbi:T4 RnlA family RNA ligase [Rossellomorea marisflavi]|uniref:T4 RnlA family RNA ligase n=1 Tax=Rossellomorea marisflavi TaxID=189381 RepID=UPI003FA10ADB